MTPYVELQMIIVTKLDSFLKNDPVWLVAMIEWYRQNPGEKMRMDDVTMFRNTGHYFPDPLNLDWVMHDIPQMILDQYDDSGPEPVIKNILGFPLYDYGKTMTISEYAKSKGNGSNFLRSDRFAQPGALRVGDRLASGETIVSEPREGGNGAVLIKVSGRKGNPTWLSIPSRTALALLLDTDDVPEGYG